MTYMVSETTRYSKGSRGGLSTFEFCAEGGKVDLFLLIVNVKLREFLDTLLEIWS